MTFLENLVMDYVPTCQRRSVGGVMVRGPGRENCDPYSNFGGDGYKSHVKGRNPLLLKG